MKKEKTFNFGKWGWILIFVCIMYQMVYSCFAVDGINGYGSSLAAMLSQKSGAQVTSDMLVMVLTPIGILACLGNIGFSSLVFKFGAKKVALVSCAVMAVSVFLFGNVSTYPQYVVCLLVTTLSGYSLAYACHHGLVGTWFPTKKGIVMGFTTMGLPLTSMIGLPYVTWCFAGKLGWRGFCYTITAIILILIVVTALFISNMPEERGVYPDNISKDHAEKMQEANDLKYFKSRYTMKSLLKNKSVWMICIGFGLPWATTAGVMSQLINRIMSTGYFESITGPVAIISGATIVGILGSFFWGWLDTKIGTKKAGVFFNLAYVVVLLIMIFLGSLPKVFCVIVTCILPVFLRKTPMRHETCTLAFAI